MAYVRNAHLRVLFEAITYADTAATPYGSGTTITIDEDDRWTDGDGSGEINRCYAVDGTLGIGANADLDIMGGALSDVYGVAIAGDECKALVVLCNTGAVSVVGGPATPLPAFTAAAAGVVLAAGQYVVLGLGASGVDCSVNGAIRLTGGAAGCTYTLAVITAQ